MKPKHNLSFLCKQCKGKCCSYVRPIVIYKNEVARLKALGATIENGIAGSELLMMPLKNGCCFLKDGSCSIYINRPKSCKEFDCRDAKLKDPNCFFFQDNPDVAKMLEETS
jgi:Fe-S-cluster containining protein